jgi:hypothetical protein
VGHTRQASPYRPMAAVGVASVLASVASGNQLRAVFDAGQSGELPPVTVLRDYATRDYAGAPVAPNQPRWGQPQIRAPLQEWSLARAVDREIPWAISGYDRNGTDPMLCYKRRDPAEIDFWIDTDIGDGPPTFTRAVTRGSITDLLVGTPQQRPFHAYAPRGGVALPGCFLFLCARWHDEKGISVVAAQRDASGTFGYLIVGDGPRLNGDDTALGEPRGRPWAMTAYYPFTAGQHPLLRAFVPVVDYIHDRAGGQVFIVEATRTAVDAAWQFGELFLIDEHVEDGSHFHTAAWTPRGVVLAMGDAPAINENILYTCDDWDDYADPAHWTKHARAYGAGTHPDQPNGTVANQFAGAVPGRDPNRVLVGGDVEGGAVYECTLPEDPGQGLTFTRRWGEFWTSGDAGGQTALWFHKPAPEWSSRSVTRVWPNIGADQVQAAAARVLYSDDDLNFLTVARLPSLGDSKALQLGGPRRCAGHLVDARPRDARARPGPLRGGRRRQRAAGER